MIDFHVYVKRNSAGVPSVDTTMDPADPLRAELLEAQAQVFEAAGRTREASECRAAKDWSVED